MAIATSIEGKITLALEQAVLAAAPAAGFPSNRIAAPGRVYTPDGVNPYLKLTIAHNTPVTVAMSGTREPMRQGILLCVVNWPAGSGTLAATEAAAKLRAAFRFNTRLPFDGGYIKIVDEPTLQGNIGDDVSVEIPVVIRWVAFS